MAEVSPTPRLPRLAWGREKGQDGPRRAAVVAKVKVIRSGIVKVDGAFDETKPQHFGVEVKIALRVGSNGCYMMQANDGFRHDSSVSQAEDSEKGTRAGCPFRCWLCFVYGK